MFRFPKRCAPVVLASMTACASIVVASPQGELTTPSAKAPASTPQLRRLTEAQYRATIADIFGADIKVVGRFEPDMRVDGLLAAGTSVVSMTPRGFEQYENLARQIAEQVVDPQHRDKLVGCGPDAADPSGQKCAKAFFERIGLRLYRRPLSPSELSLALANAEKARIKLGGDYYAGLGASLAGVLSGIEFLFQIDNTVRDPAQPAERTLDSWSRATRLSYLLWNTAPDVDLLAAAKDGSLMTEEGLSAQVDRLIASPRFLDGARALFDDYLRFDDLSTVSKDVSIYPAFRAGATIDAREQALRSLLDLLIIRKSDFRDMLTMRSMPMNGMLSPIYQTPIAEQGWSTVEFSNDHPRSGILTQVAFLAAHSHPGRSSPTLRGKAILEMLLCEEVEPPPANVNFTVVQDVSNPRFLTTRERVQAHLDDEECASCHRRMDPIGLALENFDGAGQYRAKENGAPIDTQGELDGVKFQGAAELGKVLRNHPKVSACFVETTLRYAFGRKLTATDDPLLRVMETEFSGAGYRVPHLIRAIATHPDFFRIRRSPPRAPAAASLQSSTRVRL